MTSQMSKQSLPRYRPLTFGVTRAAWRDELVHEPLWLLLGIVAAGIVLVPCPWWSRFTIWVYGLGLPCLAAAQRPSATC